MKFKFRPKKDGSCGTFAYREPDGTLVDFGLSVDGHRARIEPDTARAIAASLIAYADEMDADEEAGR